MRIIGALHANSKHNTPVHCEEGGDILSNLGDYQRIVELIKRVGGPTAAKRYAWASAGGLIILGGYAHKGLQKLEPVVKRKMGLLRSSDEAPSIPYVVTVSKTDEQGLAFEVGDEFRVMMRVEGAIMIELCGRENNPWMVSPEFLERISDFRQSVDN